MDQATCVDCGVVAPADQLVVQRGATRCPPCDERQRGAHHQRGSMWWNVGSVVLIGLAAWQRPELAQQAGLHLLGFLAVTLGLVIVHEAGHALVALIVGGRVIGVTVGQGRTLVGFRIGNCRFELRASLFGGATNSVLPPEAWKQALVFGAGVAVEAYALLLAWYWEPAGPIASSIRTSLLIAASIDIVVNLWPHRVSGVAGAIKSDGGLLFDLARGQGAFAGWSGAEAADVAAFARAIEDRDLARAHAVASAEVERHPERSDARFRLATAKLLREEWRAAYDMYLPFVDDPECADNPVLLNNLAYAAVCSFDRGLLEAADRFSQQAVTLRPTEPAFSSTRGSVLVMLGRAAEGLPMLDRALRLVDDPESKARVAGFAALGSLQLGDVSTARDHLDTVRRNDAACSLRAIVERAIGPFEVAAFAEWVGAVGADASAWPPEAVTSGRSIAAMASLAVRQLDGELEGSYTPDDWQMTANGRSVAVGELLAAARSLAEHTASGALTATSS